MGSRNGAHRFRRGFIIEENAAAAVDLEVDKAGRKNRPGRHELGRPVAPTLITRHNTLNHPTIDQEDRIIVPAMSIKNAVGRNPRLGCSGVVGWFRAHRLTSLPADWRARSIR